MYFRTEGVVIKKRNFGEADRILILFTRDYGKVVAIGKGIRRPRSKKAGHLELGNWCKVFIARGKNLDLLTEVELKRAFGIDEFSENKANKIYHLLELVDALTADHQKNPQVFILLIQYLKQCASDDFNLISSVFKIKILSQLGFFSSKNLKDSRTKEILRILETDDLESIKEKISLTKVAHLKLLTFLDSMIENLTQTKLRTSRFLQFEI